MVMNYIYYVLPTCLLFFAFKKEHQVVLSSILVKWHRVYAVAVVVPYCGNNIWQRVNTATAARIQNDYWKNELWSLGILEPKVKNQLNDKEELESLANIIKQAMFQDYKVAYTEKADAHKEEAKLTVTVG